MITLDPARPVAIVARTAGQIERLDVRVDGKQRPSESNPPYALMGNPRPVDRDDSAFYPLDLAPGVHRFDLQVHGSEGQLATGVFHVEIR